MKTNKSYTKRIKLTKGGKLKPRKKGQDHFNANQSGNKRRAKRGTRQDLNLSPKALNRFIPHN